MEGDVANEGIGRVEELDVEAGAAARIICTDDMRGILKCPAGDLRGNADVALIAVGMAAEVQRGVEAQSQGIGDVRADEEAFRAAHDEVHGEGGVAAVERHRLRSVAAVDQYQASARLVIKGSAAAVSDGELFEGDGVGQGDFDVVELVRGRNVGFIAEESAGNWAVELQEVDPCDFVPVICIVCAEVLEWRGRFNRTSDKGWAVFREGGHAIYECRKTAVVSGVNCKGLLRGMDIGGIGGDAGVDNIVIEPAIRIGAAIGWAVVKPQLSLLSGRDAADFGSNVGSGIADTVNGEQTDVVTRGVDVIARDAIFGLEVVADRLDFPCGERTVVDY